MRHPSSAAAARVAAVERLRAAGMTAAAACAQVGMSPSSYYRARRSPGQARRAGRVQVAARPVRLQITPAHWTPAAPDMSWLHLAPPWGAPGAIGFSPFAVLKPPPHRPPPPRPRRPQGPMISPRPAPVVDRMNAAPDSPLRLRASLAHRAPHPLHGALNGLAAAPGLLRQAGPILTLAALALLFGMTLTRTAANPAAMHLSDAAAQARMVAGAE